MKKEFLYFLSNTIGRCMTSKFYLKIVYRIKVGKKLNLKNPITYTEKQQWLKLNFKNETITRMADKYEAKEIARKVFGEKFVIHTYGVYDKFDDINFNELPNSFVIKCTHDSGGIVICKDKKNLNIKKARKKINKALKLNYFYTNREWQYKNIKRRIIVEEYLENSNLELCDYKVVCFNGKASFIQYHSGRFSGCHYQDIYDLEWNKRLDINQAKSKPSPIIIEKPKVLSEMIELSEKVSKGFPHLRIDWYINDDKLYFGEFTLYDASGFEAFVPEKLNVELGKMIDLSLVK